MGVESTNLLFCEFQRFYSLARRGILRAFALRMTAVPENGIRKAENGICENLLFREFDDSLPLPGGGFFGLSPSE